MEPIAPDLLADLSEGPALLGGRERTTGRIVFPLPADRDRFESVELPRAGRIWSWTIQRFRPKTPPYAGPDDFEPFALGYVELPGAVIVETRFTGFAFDALKVGLPCRLVVEPFGPKMTYAFAPLETAS